MNKVAALLTGFAAIFGLVSSATAEYLTESSVLDTGAPNGYLQGWSVSLSGDTALVATMGVQDTLHTVDTIYRFDRVDGVWSNAAMLLTATADIYDQSGPKTAICGENQFVGVPGENSSDGGVYIYSSLNMQHATGVPGYGEKYGISVDVSCEMGVAGAPNANSGQGGAYVFSKSTSDWSVEEPPLPEGMPAGTAYGDAVAIEGTLLAVGAPYYLGSGAVFLYEMADKSWTETAMLSGDAETYTFGYSVDLSNGVVLVGAPDENGGAGAVYFFERIGGAWVKTAKFAGNGYFGNSVALDYKTAVVGGMAQNGGAGSAFLFHNIRGEWKYVNELMPSDGVPGDTFGMSVAVCGGTALVGAPNHNGNTGAIYVFDGIGAPDDSAASLEAIPGVDGVLLRWPASTDVTIQGYNVYREGGPMKYGDLLNPEGPIKETSFLDTTAEPGGVYVYNILVVLSDGTEAFLAGPAEAVAGRVAMLLGGISNAGGADIMVPVSINNASGVGRQHMVFDIAYPAELVAGEVGVSPAALTADMTFTIQTIGYGVVEVTGEAPSNTTPLVGDGPLFYLTMTLRDDLTPPQCGPVSFLPDTGAFLNDTAGEAIDVDSSSQGWVCINPDCILGDLDYNAQVQAPDAQIITDIKVGLRTPDDCQRYSGDLNVDRRIDSADAIIVLRMANGRSIVPAPEDPFALPRIFEEGGQVTLSVDHVTAAPGEDVVVPLRIAGATGLAAFSFSLAYPPELFLQFTTVGELDDTLSLTTYSAAAGSAAFSGATGNGLPVETSTGVLGRLHFIVPSDVPAGAILPITVADIHLTSVYGEDFSWYAEVVAQDGAVTIAGGEGEGSEGEGPSCCCTGNKQLPSWADAFMALLSVGALLGWRLMQR